MIVLVAMKNAEGATLDCCYVDVIDPNDCTAEVIEVITAKGWTFSIGDRVEVESE